MEKETRSEAYYLDDDHNIVDPDKATKVVINEYDENGVMIREIWGYTDRIQRNKENQKKRGNFGWLGRLLRGEMLQGGK